MSKLQWKIIGNMQFLVGTDCECRVCESKQDNEYIVKAMDQDGNWHCVKQGVSNKEINEQRVTEEIN